MSDSAELVDRFVEGPSFHLGHKVLATLMVLALLVFGAQAARQPGMASLDLGIKALLLTGFGVVLAAWWSILKSRTRIDGRCIRQSWLWPKEVKLAEITQLKLVHVQGLSWLIAPRLIVSTSGIGRTVFPAADPAVLSAFRQLALGPDGPPQSAPPP